MKKQVRIHHLKSDEVEIELFADYEFRYGDVNYYIEYNGYLYGYKLGRYWEVRNLFLELAYSWGWSAEDCERS